MRLEERFDAGVLTWELPPVESATDAGVDRVRDSVSFALPESFDPTTLHPDLRAAAALLVLRPFVGPLLELPVGVSPAFAQTVRAHLGTRLEPVDPTRQPRRPDDGRVGLCFSGGADSMAVLDLFGHRAVCIYSERRRPDGDDRPSFYRPDGALRACREVRAAGFEVHEIPTDLEFLRDPIGFPVHARSAVESSGACVALLADVLGLDAVSWGTIAETAYHTGFGPFRDHAANIEHDAWRQVLEAVGLPVLNPLAGVSEVGSALLAASTDLPDVAQSCVRGVDGEPCMDCFKCVRKTLLTAATGGRWPAEEEMQRLMLVREFRRRLRMSPVPLHGVLLYSLDGYRGAAPYARLVRQRLGPRRVGMSYLERWYGPTAELWPSRYRETVTVALDERLGRMTDRDERKMRRWHPDAWDADPAVEAEALALVRLLDAAAGPQRLARELEPGVEPLGALAFDRRVELDDRLEAARIELRTERARLRELERSPAHRRARLLSRVATRVRPW